MDERTSRALKRAVSEGLAEATDEFGYAFGSPSSLYDIFVAPSLDVAKIARAELSKAAARTKAIGKKAFEAIVSTVVPILDGDYDEIDAETAREIEAAVGRAGGAYDEVKRAFGGKDALAFAFLYSPTAFVTSAAVKKLSTSARRLFGLSEAAGGLTQLARAQRKKLQRVASLGAKIASAKTSDDLSRALGKRVAVDPAALPTVRAALVKSLAAKLEREASALTSAGVPERAPVVTDLRKAVSSVLKSGG